PTPVTHIHTQQRSTYAAQQTPAGTQYNAQVTPATMVKPPIMVQNQGQPQNMPVYQPSASPYYQGHQAGQHPAQHSQTPSQHQYAPPHVQPQQTPAQYPQSRQPPYATAGGVHSVKMQQQQTPYPSYQ